MRCIYPRGISLHLLISCNEFQYLVSKRYAQNVSCALFSKVRAIFSLRRGAIAEGYVLRPRHSRSPAASIWFHEGLIQLRCSLPLLARRFWSTPWPNDHDVNPRMFRMAVRTRTFRSTITQSYAHLLNSLHTSLMQLTYCLQVQSAHAEIGFCPNQMKMTAGNPASVTSYSVLEAGEAGPFVSLRRNHSSVLDGQADT